MAESVTRNPDDIIPTGTDNIADLVAKHQAKIDAIVGSTQPEQEKFFIDHGIDPDKLMIEKYPDLIQRSEELRIKNDIATKKAGNVSKFAFLASGIGLLFIPKTAFSNKGWIKAMSVAFGAITASIVSYFASTKFLTRDIRIAVEKSAFSLKAHPQPKESEKLAISARNALEKELAVLFENDERNNKEYVIKSDKRDAARYMDAKAQDGSFAAKVGVQQTKINPPADSHAQTVSDQSVAAGSGLPVR